MKKLKQVTYLSAILISVGSTIGAGIFFKNNEIFANAHGSLGFLIASWLVAAIGVMAIGLALVEISSANKSGGGLLEWVQKFTHKRFSKYSAGYMVMVFLPLNYFALPIYASLSLQDTLDAYKIYLGGWGVAGISFSFFLWFASMGFFQQKVSEKTQWVFTISKFLPLLIIPILSLVDTSNDGIGHYTGGIANGLTHFSPWLGLMGSIPAILFAVDGFYTVTSLKPELKNEKKLGSIIAISISIIMSVYLVFAILTSFSGKGYSAISFFEKSKWLKPVADTFIMIAVLGIVNGFAIAAPKMYLDTHQKQPIGIVKLTQKFSKIKSAEKAAWFSSIWITTLFFIVLIPIGIYAFNSDHTGYDFYPKSAGIFELTDLITSFTSMIVFSFICVTIIGSVQNRKTKKIRTTRTKYHLLVSWIAIIFISIGGIYMFLSGFINMFGVGGSDIQNSAIKYAVLIVTTTIPTIPIIIDKYSGN